MVLTVYRHIWTVMRDTNELKDRSVRKYKTAGFLFQPSWSGRIWIYHPDLNKWKTGENKEQPQNCDCWKHGNKWAKLNNHSNFLYKGNSGPEKGKIKQNLPMSLSEGTEIRKWGSWVSRIYSAEYHTVIYSYIAIKNLRHYYGPVEICEFIG